MAFKIREWHVNDVDEGLVDVKGKSVKTKYETVTGYGDANDFATKCANGDEFTSEHGEGPGYILSVNSTNSFSTGPEVTYTAVSFPGLVISKKETFKKNKMLYRVSIMIEWALGGGGAATVSVPTMGFFQGGMKTLSYKGNKIFVGKMYKSVEWEEHGVDENGDPVMIPWTKTTYVDRVNELGRAYVCKRMFFPGKTVQSNIHPEVTSIDFSEPPDPPGTGSCTYGEIAEQCFAAAGIPLAGGIPAIAGIIYPGENNYLVWATCADWNPMPLSQVVQWVTNMSGYFIYADSNNDLRFAKPTTNNSGGVGGGCAGSEGKAYDAALDFKSIACYCRGDRQLVGSGLPCGYLIDNTKDIGFLAARAQEILDESVDACVSISKRGTLDTVELVPGSPYRSYSVNVSFLTTLETAAGYLDKAIDLNGIDCQNSVEVVY